MLIVGGASKVQPKRNNTNCNVKLKENQIIILRKGEENIPSFMEMRNSWYLDINDFVHVSDDGFEKCKRTTKIRKGNIKNK